MQTERITFLASPDHKAALDAFAADKGMSVGHVVREATMGYMAQQGHDEAEARAAVLSEAEQALPVIQKDLEAIRSSIAAARAAIAAALADPSRLQQDKAA